MGRTVAKAAGPGVNRAEFDVTEFEDALELLRGDLRTHLARSMGVAGGQVLRDEAKARAPVKDGVLRASIYLAYRESGSNDKRVQYVIAWNGRKAPHGHLLEFGHWQPFKVAALPDGRFYTMKTRLPSPKWIPARPFLRPALTGAADRVRAAMIARGRERLPQLLRQQWERDAEGSDA